YCASLFILAFGLMSKPMLVTLPCVMLLLDYWPLGRFQLLNGSSRLHVWARLLWEKGPFVALAVASSVVTLVAQREAGAVTALEALPLELRIANALVSYVRYVAKM